ncbi:helix-turn-helix transcriptional regulator [Bradyrhizobium sp. STM 3566]|uniref:helix-turn-helix transcriptional regulator n=1 Tax=Bradyrhizobium sp. STM 3566 TaxID=578928 RepID=UPI00388EF9EA
MQTLRLSETEDLSDVTAAVLAIGRPAFSCALMDALSRIAGVDHCMVFAFHGERSVRPQLDIGSVSIAGELGAAYADHFHLADPNRDVIFGKAASAFPILLPAFSRRMYNANYAKMFFEDAGIVDKVAAAIWVDYSCFYVNLYRTRKRGPFIQDQVGRLSRITPTVAAAVARHFQGESLLDEDPFQRLEALFSRPPLIRLTPREKEVCVRILSGLGSETISADLGIGLQTVLTYRKRAYGKLGISSQNELFAIVLRLASPQFVRQ